MPRLQDTADVLIPELAGIERRLFLIGGVGAVLAILGAVLRGLWPKYLSTEELFQALRLPSNSYSGGPYAESWQISACKGPTKLLPRALQPGDHSGAPRERSESRP